MKYLIWLLPSYALAFGTVVLFPGTTATIAILMWASLLTACIYMAVSDLKKVFTSR